MAASRRSVNMEIGGVVLPHEPTAPCGLSQAPVIYTKGPKASIRKLYKKATRLRFPSYYHFPSMV